MEEDFNGEAVNSRREELNATTNTVLKKRNSAAMQLHEEVRRPRTSAASGMKQENGVRVCQSAVDLRSSSAFHAATETSSVV